MGFSYVQNTAAVSSILIELNNQQTDIHPR